MYSDGKVRIELNQKLAVAWGDFQKLALVWRHAQISKRRKLQAFQAMVVSRLLYGLSTAWLNVADMRRLNGFQARCLRVILRIPPAFVSRVSNRHVLQMAEEIELGNQLLKQQLLLYGQVVRSLPSDPRRDVTFAQGPPDRQLTGSKEELDGRAANGQ